MKSKILLILFFIIPIISVFATTAPGNVQIRHFQIPIIVGEPHNPIVRIQVISNDNPNVESIKLDLSGSSNLSDIEKLSLYYSGEDSLFKSDYLLSEISDVKPLSEFLIDKKLALSESYLWISCTLKPDVKLTNKVQIEVKDILYDIGDISILSQKLASSTFRYGVAVRSHGQDGVDTYRIPGLATSEEGTLFAIYDVRRESARDLQGDIDIGLNRSFNGGKTWQPLQIVIDMKEWGELQIRCLLH